MNYLRITTKSTGHTWYYPLSGTPEKNASDTRFYRGLREHGTTKYRVQTITQAAYVRMFHPQY